MNECSQNANNCSQNCMNTPGSYKCKCLPGFKSYDDGITCQDIDECREKDMGCQYFWKTYQDHMSVLVQKV